MTIDAHCLKCKLVLAHIVLYEVDGAISKVKCKTCGAEHKYRGIKPPAKKGDAPRAASKAKPARTAAGGNAVNPAPVQWEAHKNNMEPDTPVKVYRLQDHYQVKDVIQHAVFGLGFVERIVSEKRMDVLFHDAVRSLVMNLPT
jgi:hypothetical protein